MNDGAIRIELLGAPRLLLNGEQVSTDTRKAVAVLAYLTVEGTTRRDKMAAVLWPDSAGPQARSTLRRTLSAIRSALGPSALVTDNDQISLEKAVGSDVEDFTALSAELSQHDHDDDEVCSRCVPILRNVTKLYRSDFLAGFSLKDSAEFDDWTRLVAERFRLECERHYERFAAAEAANGDYLAAIEAVNGWLELAPLREPAYRQLMLMHGWAGDGPGATAAYRRCVATLQGELGVSPLAETTELLDAILDEDLPPAPGVRRRIIAPSRIEIRAPNLIGRTAELERLNDAINRGGTLIRVVGDAWMGKTRMLDECEFSARQSGMGTISARGYPTEQHVPYGVVSQLVAEVMVADQWEAKRAEVPEWALRETARIAPGLAEPPPEASRDPFRETRLRDGLAEVISSIARLIVVDDAQWSDQASMSILGLLGKRLPDSGLVVLLAHRPDVSDDMLPLIGPTDRAQQVIVRLKPLKPEELESLGGAGEIEEIVERTGGIPALVADALAHESGKDLLPSVQAYMEERLHGVSELTRQVLSAASVLGGSADFDLLKDTCGRSEEEVLDAVEWLTSRGILEPADDDGRVEFALDPLRDLTYANTSLLRRRLLHRRAAAGLDGPGGAAADLSRASVIARHLRLGGLDHDAALWYERAGGIALRIFAPEDAVESLLKALALGHPDPTRLYLSIGDAHLQMSRYTDALSQFELAASLAESSTLAVAEHKVGEAHRRLGHIEKAIEQFAKAAPSHPDPSSLFSDWALAALRLGDRPQAVTRAKTALRATEGSPPESRSRALTVLGIVTEDPDESEHLLNEALTLADEDQALRMAALNAIAHEESRHGESALALTHLEEAADIAAEIGDRHRRAALLDHLASLHHQTGNQARAEELQMEAMRLFADVEPGSWEPEIWLLTYW